jgi:anthranilate phosphoribosyltransferase
VTAILAGEAGPKRDIVLLNGAYALVAAGLAADVDAGIEIAAKAIDEGRAAKTLASLVRMTNS